MIRIKIVLNIGLILDIYSHVIISNSPDNQQISNIDTDLTFINSKDAVPSTDSMANLQYKYVLIAFRRIMEWKTKGTGFTAILHDIKLIIDFYKPTEKQILSEENFNNLLADGVALLTSYRSVFVSTSDYPTKAYYFRLLLWLQFSMRRTNNANESLESAIFRILSANGENEEPPINVLQEVYIHPKWDIEEQCHHITTFTELQEFGTVEDQIVGFCLLLGELGESAAKNVKVIMPFSNNVRLYENFINDMLSIYGRFRRYFQKYPIEILAYVYKAVHFRHGIEYKRSNGEDINLYNFQSNYDQMQYLCNIMTLYNHAIEEIIPKKPRGWFFFFFYEETVADNILQLENFYNDMKQFSELDNDPQPYTDMQIDEKKFEILRMNVLKTLISNVTSINHQKIQNLANKNEWPDDSKLYYGRLLGWLIAYIDQTFEDKDQLAWTLRRFRDDTKSIIHVDALKLEHNFKENSYLEVTTLKELVLFCRSGEKPTIFYDTVGEDDTAI